MDVKLKFQSITVLKLWVLYLCGTKWPFVSHCLLSNWRAPSSCTQLTWANRLGSLVRWTCSTSYAASLFLPRPHSYGRSHHRSSFLTCISAALSWCHSWQIISYLRVRSLKSHKMKCLKSILGKNPEVQKSVSFEFQKLFASSWLLSSVEYFID